LASTYIFRGTNWAKSVLAPLAIGRDERAQLIRSIILFHDLSDQEVRALASRLTVQRLDAGEVIFRQGDLGEKFYIVQAGGVELVAEQPGMGRRVLARLGKGAYFGEMALLEGRPRAATARATEETQLLALGKAHFDEFVDRHEAAAEKIAETANGIRALRQIPLFSELDDHQIAAILTRLSPERFSKDAIIIRQGDLGDKFYVVREGEVRVSRQDNGSARVVATLGKGEYFGEIALLQNVPRTATVTASTDVQLWSLGAKDFLALVGASATALRNLELAASRRVHDLRARTTRRNG